MYSNNKLDKIGKAICHLQRALSFGVQGTENETGNCDDGHVDAGLPQIDDKYIPSNSRSDIWFFTWSEYPHDWEENLHVIFATYHTTVEVKCNWGAIPQETPQGRKFLVGFVEHKKTKHRFPAPVIPRDHENLVYKNGKGIFFGYSVGKKTTPRPPQCANGGLPGMLMFLTKHGTEGARYSIGLPFQHIMYTDGNKRRIGWGDCKDRAKIRWGYVAPKGHTYVVPYDSNGGFFNSIKGSGDWRERPILVNNGDIEELIEVYLKPKDAKRKKGNLSTKPNKSKRKRSRPNPTPEMLEDTGTQHGAADTQTAQGASEHMDPFFKQVSIDNDDSFNLELRKDWPSSLDLLSDSTDFTETQTPQTPQNLDTSKETTHAPGDLDEILKYLKELQDLNS